MDQTPGSELTVATAPGSPNQDLPGPVVDSTLVALVADSPSSAVLNGANGFYRITTAEELQAFASRFQGQDGKPMFTVEILAEASAALADGQVLAAGIVHQGCFPVGGAVLVQGQDGLELAATDIDPQEMNTNCYIAVASVAIVAATPEDLPADAMTSIQDLPGGIPTGPPPATDPALPGKEIASTEVAVASGSVPATDIVGPFRITTAEQLIAFADRYTGMDGKPMFSDSDLAQARTRVLAGQVLAAGVVSSGCFPAGGAVLAQDGDQVVMVPTGIDPQEGSVQCVVAITTVVILAADTTELSADQMPSADTMPN